MQKCSVSIGVLVCILAITVLDVKTLVNSQTGGGVRTSDQPPAPSPSPSSFLFPDVRLAAAYSVIQTFKNTVTSDPLNVTASWIGADVCNYRGFFCDIPPDNGSALAVASVDFNGFYLAAPTVAGFIDQLPDLALFHANSNKFSGTIPSSISKLPYLYELDISNNLFSGPFPTSILTMSSLSFLDIRFNFFSGAVPPQLFSKELDVLFINNNNFLTRLPENVSVVNGRLLYLTLANNRFFGPIPRSISRSFSGLTEILLLNNLLSGCLPYELGFLKQAVLFDAGNNRLTGPLPFSLGCLQNLEILNFAGNLLFGTVPDSLCNVRNLANLSLSGNYFTRVGTSCWKLISSGVLDLRRNCISGLPLQRSAAECAAFYAYPRYCPHMASYAHYFPCWTP